MVLRTLYSLGTRESYLQVVMYDCFVLTMDSTLSSNFLTKNCRKYLLSDLEVTDLSIASYQLTPFRRPSMNSAEFNLDVSPFFCTPSLSCTFHKPLLALLYRYSSQYTLHMDYIRYTHFTKYSVDSIYRVKLIWYHVVDKSFEFPLRC